MSSNSDNSGLISAALAITQPVLALSMDVEGSFRDWIRTSGNKVSLYRAYERGDHRASITDQMRKMLRLVQDGSGITDFCDNYAGLVVDKMAGRLHVTEITLKEPTADKEWLTPLLEFNNFDSLQGTLFRGAIRDGDSYAMVDPQTLEWTSEPAYDGYSGVFALFYNNSNTPYWACKLWSEASELNQKETMCVVVYEEGKISYWRGQEEGNELIPDNQVLLSDLLAQSKQLNIELKYDPAIDPAVTYVNYRPWPLDRAPIVHFVNKYDNYSDGGESELRPAIPLQDVLNRTLHSMVMASEMSAFSLLWSIGMEIPLEGIVPGGAVNLVLKDPISGKLVIEPTEAMLQFLNAVKVGQFQGSDITQYTEQIDKLVREISQATQTPIYGITNQGMVSGEALKQLEIGLIGKCERFQRQNTDAVRELIRISADIQNTFQTEYDKGTPPAEITTVGVTWKSPEILDVGAQIQVFINLRKDAANLWDDDFYRSKIGGLLGMSQSQIDDESAKIKNTTSNNLMTLIGGNGGIPVA